MGCQTGSIDEQEVQNRRGGGVQVSESDTKLIDRLIQCMAAHRPQLDWSNNYYEAQYRLTTLGISTPPEMRTLASTVGWGRLYVDSLEERLELIDFRLGGATQYVDELRQWWQANNLDPVSAQVHIDALIYGRCYITVAADEEVDFPRIVAESPINMYAEVDFRTGKITSAIRVYVDPLDSKSEYVTLFLPDRTSYYRNSGKGQSKWAKYGDDVEHNLGQVPVVCFSNRRRVGDPYGGSEIIRELRHLIDAASRMLMNLQAAAELMAVPQRLIFGVKPSQLGLPDATDPDQSRTITDAYMARIMAIDDVDAKAFQFTAAELRNYIDGIESLAKLAASYTGLPPQYLSFASDNPASAEAIRSAETRIVRKCEKLAQYFGADWEDVMRLATLVQNGSVPSEYARLESRWANPATPTEAAKADAVVKKYASGNGPIPLKYARIDLGYTSEEIKDMEQLDANDPMKKINLALQQKLLEAPDESEEETGDKPAPQRKTGTDG